MGVYALKLEGRTVIKIGSTAWLWQRVTKLQAKTDIKLLPILWIPSWGEKEERAAHFLLRNSCIRGEYFRLDADVQSWLAEHDYLNKPDKEVQVAPLDVRAANKHSKPGAPMRWKALPRQFDKPAPKRWQDVPDDPRYR